MKLSDKELVRLMREADRKPSKGSNGWLGTLIVLFLAILAFLYENAGR